MVHVQVADAEVLFLEDPDLPLSQLAFELRKHAAVLPALHDLVRKSVVLHDLSPISDGWA
jgi:hypothetical protein